MKRNTRSILINAIALAVAFIAMIAALAYVPAKNDSLAHVFGKVTDENGSPLGNVTVSFDGTTFETNTDQQGYYSASLSANDFGVGSVHCVASDDSRFSQKSDIRLNTTHSEIRLNFVLVNDTDFVFAAGPVVLFSTSSGLTRADISTYLENSARLYFGGFSILPPRSYSSLSFSKTSDNGSLTYHGLEAWFEGTALNQPGPDCFVDWSIGMQPDDATGVFPVGNDTLSQDYIDRASVASLSTFYNLDLGQNVTISASPKGNVTLPEQLTPQLNLAFSNSTIKNGPLNYSYQYSYDEYGRTVTGDNATEATVTLTPLTPGTHHYQVYIEQNYIIHVWELPN